MNKETVNTNLIENVHYNIVTEQRILGLIMADNSLLESIAHIKKEYFFYEEHKHIFEVMLLLKNDAKDITPNSVASNMSMVKDVSKQDSDNEPYLMSLLEGYKKERLSISNVAVALITFWQLRETHNTLVLGLDLSTVQTSKFNKKSMFGIIDRLTAIYQSTDASVYSTLNSKMVTLLEQIQSGEIANKTLKCGYYEFDEYDMCFRKGDLTTIGAYTGHGKTSFALNVGIGLARNHHPTLFVSLELSEDDLMSRMISICSAVELEKITKNSPSNPVLTTQDFEKMMDINDGYMEHINVVYKACGINEIIALYRIENFQRLKSGNKKLDCLIIDYVKPLYDYEPNKEKGVSTADGIGILCGKLKDFAEKEKISVILLAQLNRESQSLKDDEMPNSKHIAESTNITRWSDVMLLINPVKDSTTEIAVKVEKNRKSGAGIIRNFSYDRATQKITAVRHQYNDFQSKIIGDK